MEEKLVNDIKSCETLFASIQEKIIAPLGQLEEQKKKLNEVIKERQMIISSWKKNFRKLKLCIKESTAKLIVLLYVIVIMICLLQTPGK